jgi:S-adenosylmethionine-diacylglycerol 3-amino-3-carboxypropyl transferase
MEITTKQNVHSEIAQSMSLDIIRYSQVWEDYSVLCHGLDINQGDDVLSIASSGCNVFAMLLAGANSVTAIDMSSAQIALVELKVAAIKTLSHDQFLAFIGATKPTHDRLNTYLELKGDLSAESQCFWALNYEAIQSGIMHCGRFDRYLRLFLDSTIKDLWTEGVAEALLDAKNLTEQKRIYETYCDTKEFRSAFINHASREIISLLGRDPAQLKYVDTTDLGSHFLSRFRNGLLTVSNHNNFYLEYCLIGKYRHSDNGPPYMQRANFDRLKSLVHKICLVTDEIENHLSHIKTGTYNKVNLSDIFEYMNEQSTQKLFALLASKLRHKGRLAYWNLLVARTPDQTLHQQLNPLTEQSQQLHQSDRTWFYQSFHLYEVMKS